MRYATLLLLFCTATFVNVAQKNERRPIIYSTEYIVRAKALGFVIIEDLWVRTFSAGAEVRWNERFSIAADIVHFRWRYETEVYNVPDDPEAYNEYSEYDPRNYLALELRYYPSFLEFESFRLYVNGFTKWGKRRTYLENNHPVTTGSTIRLRSDFMDLGTSIGAQIGSNWGFDCNIGAAYRRERIIRDVLNEDQTLSEEHKTDDHWIPNIRVNFYYNLSW